MFSTVVHTSVTNELILTFPHLSEKGLHCFQHGTISSEKAYSRDRQPKKTEHLEPIHWHHCRCKGGLLVIKVAVADLSRPCVDGDIFSNTTSKVQARACASDLAVLEATIEDLRRAIAAACHVLGRARTGEGKSTHVHAVGVEAAGYAVGPQSVARTCCVGA